MEAAEREAYVEDVLSLVESIPPGRVMAYGQVAECVERGGPRQVGAVMSAYGSGVPWWRVVRADGTLPQCHQRSALDHYRVEATPLRGAGAGQPGSTRVDMAQAAWRPVRAGRARS